MNMTLNEEQYSSSVQQIKIMFIQINSKMTTIQEKMETTLGLIEKLEQETGSKGTR